MIESQIQTDGPFVGEDGSVFICGANLFTSIRLTIPPDAALRMARSIIAKHEQIEAEAGRKESA